MLTLSGHTDGFEETAAEGVCWWLDGSLPHSQQQRLQAAADTQITLELTKAAPASIVTIVATSSPDVHRAFASDAIVSDSAVAASVLHMLRRSSISTAATTLPVRS